MKKIYFILATLLFTFSPAIAAPTANSFVTPQTPNLGLTQFVQGTDVAGTFKTLYTAGANGSRCYGMWMANDDNTTTHAVQVEINRGAFVYIFQSVTTVQQASYASGAQSLMTWSGLPVDQYGNSYIQLAASDIIKVTFLTALGVASQINVGISCSDY